MLLLLTVLLASSPKSITIADTFEINCQIDPDGSLFNVCIFALDRNGEIVGIPRVDSKFEYNTCKPLPLSFQKPKKVNGRYVVDFNGYKVTSRNLVVTKTTYNRARRLHQEWIMKYSQ